MWPAEAKDVAKGLQHPVAKCRPLSCALGKVQPCCVTHGRAGAVPTMGLNPEDSSKVLPGLDACKSPNPSSLKDGCLATSPSVGTDEYGLW